jgi:hypothetical protein
MNDSPPTREVHCTDALGWLEARPSLPGCSLVASLPDISEFPKLSLADWGAWFVRTATLILSRCPDDGITFFYQSDIKMEGAWVDKGYLCQKAAETLGHAQLVHRIACRVPAGVPSHGRPGYSHLLAFSRGVRVTDHTKANADVLNAADDKLWTRGLGLQAGLAMGRFIREHTSSHTVVNPFCGEGSMLAIANHLGLNAIGLERSLKRAERSRHVQVAPNGQNWR